MITGSNITGFGQSFSGNGFVHRLIRSAGSAAALIVLGFTLGCQAPIATPITQAHSQPDALTLREADVLKISFPAAPNLDTTQQIRRDGRITMPVIGELVVAGFTPSGLEQELIKQYSTQLISKEVSVTVVSSTFTVFVSGAVVRPGKVTSDHPLSALEAVMEAGGFDSAKADMRAVVITRQEAGQYKNYTVDLKLVLEGKQAEPFYLKPSDILFVPEKFAWF